MDFTLPEEYRMLRRTVREFRDNEVRPVLDDVDPDASHLPDAKRRELRERAEEIGLWGIANPQEYGGGGLDILGRVVVIEELSQHRFGLYGSYGVDLTPGIGVGSPEVYLETANDHHMEKFIGPAMRGELDMCFALTEPAGGSDISNIQTTAVKEGDEWVVNGEKRFTSGAGWADYAILFAQTRVDGEDKGMTCFLVDTSSEGWNIRREIDAIRPYPTFEIDIDDLRIPDEDRFSDVGGGLELAASGVRASRVTMAAQHVGVSIHALEQGLEYTQDRETFGKPLADRQAIQWMLAESALDIHTTRLLTYETAWKADRGIDVRHEASMVKLHSSRTLQEVIDRVMQMHGGIAMTKDLPLERWYREARVRRIVEGPTEIHLRTIARNLIKGYEPVDLMAKIE